MKLKKILALLAFAVAGITSAHATVVTTIAGPNTIYTENFNGGTSFSGAWFDTLFNSDDYLFLSVFAPTSSYTFSSATALSSLMLKFWYSVPGNNNGMVTLFGSTALSDTPGNVVQFLLNNPGPSTGGTNNYDAQFAASFSNLAAGSYTLTFSTMGGVFDALKVDDVEIVATAVPEPGTSALMLAGIGLLALRGRKKKQDRVPS